MKPRAALAVLAACWLGACSFPEYRFEPVPAVSICADGQLSEAETGIDCGGGCPPCGLGETCEIAADCVTLACFDAVCQMPTCDDSLKNGAESDRDCGGQCEPCATGRDCGALEDCQSRVCEDRTCQAPTCLDGVENGDETSEDCGGSCSPCPLGSSCQADSDCESIKCAEMICVSALCTDGVANANETDVDCGGNECGPCSAGRDCQSGSDCASLICDGDEHCTAAACDDDTLNGNESDLDCGGDGCPGCENLKRCQGAADCASDTCQSGLCVPAQATGTALSRDAWNATASDTFAGDSPNEALDGLDHYWWSGEAQTPGMYFEVDMAELQAFFSVELTCNVTDDMPVRFRVFFSSDGDFSDEEPVREDIQGFALTTIEFATAQVARYIRIELTEGIQRWWCIEEFNVYE